MEHRKLRMGMVGGGRDAFIGSVHRMAAALDGQIDLVAGAFSSDPEKSRASGADLYLDPSRVYEDYEAMAEAETSLPADQRIDFVAIVTPNHMHYPVAKCFLEAGFHVVCDKPVTRTVEEAEALQEIVQTSGRVFALTHNYTGYPMVKEARHLVESGHLGRILKIVVEYPQGWLLSAIDAEGQKQAAWRTDPEKAGASSCMGDIGTHAENLARYVTGLRIESLCADFSTMVSGRRLEDDGNLLVHYEGGARGVLYASQVSAGEENALRLRVYGEKAGLEWFQEEPNELLVKYPDRPREVYRRGNDYLSDAAKTFSRIPFGHPEAFIEAFANVYLEAARAIRDAVNGRPGAGAPYDFPTVEDGVEGMKFIASAVESARQQNWLKMRS
ncbi:MAG: Gfo/Idh/MocA family oxidoreductase [Verrucomicrobia bacterium]|jgi:predicted dehydrogenase|nr:Gfo/Idh/MocA family oxidoreductase [Verrucomicrobiota bacterium]